MDPATVSVAGNDGGRGDISIDPGFLDGEEDEYYDEVEYDEEYYEEQTGAPGDVAQATTDDAPRYGGDSHHGRGANAPTEPVQVSLHTQFRWSGQVL